MSVYLIKWCVNVINVSEQIHFRLGHGIGSYLISGLPAVFESLKHNFLAQTGYQGLSNTQTVGSKRQPKT